MELKLLIILLFAATVSAKTPFLVGSKKCTWGPSYWCKDMKSAAECDAVEHCQENVWKNPIKEKPFPCGTCKEVIGKIKTFVEDKSVEDKIIVTIDKLCGMLPAELAEKCKEVLNDNIKNVFAKVDAIVKDPLKFCQKLGLCSAKSEEEIAQALVQYTMTSDKHASALLLPGPVILSNQKAKISLQPKNTESCVLCEFVMRELSKILNKTSTKEDIENALNKVCSYMPGTIETECKRFVQEFGPSIIEILVQEFKPDVICTKLKLCSSSMIKTVLGLLQLKLKASNETCDECMNVVKEIQKVLSDGVTVKEIESLLGIICTYIPVPALKQECNTAVTELTPEIIKYITSQDPKTICMDIDICPAGLKKLSGPTMIGNMCYLGASHWCANKTNARKCKAEHFCNKYVWIK